MLKILVVEDEGLIRHMAVEDLLEAGYAVDQACDGDKALSMIRSGQTFDLLFTDIRMPGSVDGWGLARLAREQIPNLKVIFATGYSEQVGKLCDADRFLKKPYRLPEVLKAIDELTTSLA